MKFYEALKEMQENKTKCRPVGLINATLFFYWNTTSRFPCLRNSREEEISVNGWLMNATWEYAI